MESAGRCWCKKRPASRKRTLRIHCAAGRTAVLFWKESPWIFSKHPNASRSRSHPGTVRADVSASFGVIGVSPGEPGRIRGVDSGFLGGRLIHFKTLQNAISAFCRKLNLFCRSYLFRIFKSALESRSSPVFRIEAVDSFKVISLGMGKLKAAFWGTGSFAYRYTQIFLSKLPFFYSVFSEVF